MSSTKKVIEPYHFLINQSTGASFSTGAVDCRYMDRICFELIWTGTATGSIIPETSLDATNWVALDMDTIVLAGVADSGIFDITVTSIPYVRLAFTRTGGTGTINGWRSAKES